MKAITLTQPWATLVAHRLKTIETRSWNIKYRGSLAIHAAKGFPTIAQRVCFTYPFRFYLAKLGYVERNDTRQYEFPFGAIIATCELVSCVLITEASQEYGWQIGSKTWVKNECELAFGDFTPGRYAWLLADIKMLANPIPAKGSLGLWEWRDE